MELRRRTGHPAFTVGKCYDISTSGGVRNDNGRRMYVNAIHPRVSKHWEILDADLPTFDANEFKADGTETDRFTQPTEEKEEKMKYIKRLTPTRHLTIDKVYEIHRTYYITDDSGDDYRIATPPRGGSNACWEDVTNYSSLGFETLLEREATINVRNHPLFKENNMLTMKKTILINGRDCDDLPNDHIMELIDEEQRKVDRITGTLAGSKALTKLTKQHEENIVTLIKIIDARSAE